MEGRVNERITPKHAALHADPDIRQVGARAVRARRLELRRGRAQAAQIRAQPRALRQRARLQHKPARRQGSARDRGRAFAALQQHSLCYALRKRRKRTAAAQSRAAAST